MDTKETIKWLAGVHKEIWLSLVHVPESDRASSANSLFIETMKRIRYPEPPKTPETGLPATKPPEAMESPKDAPPSVHAKEVPPANGPDEPPEVPKTECKGIIEHTHKGKAEGLESFEGREQPKEAVKEPPRANELKVTEEDAVKRYGDGYDRANLRWTLCVKHPEEEINHLSRDGRPYQKCVKCCHYLNADGKRVPYDPNTGIPIKKPPMETAPYKKETVKGLGGKK